MSVSLLTRAFGRAVKARRAELDITQGDLGKRSGLDRSYLSGIERGNQNPSFKKVALIADALDTPLSTLLESAERIAGSMTRG